jgi:hypothetical protein
VTSIANPKSMMTRPMTMATPTGLRENNTIAIGAEWEHGHCRKRIGRYDAGDAGERGGNYVHAP